MPRQQVNIDSLITAKYGANMKREYITTDYVWANGEHMPESMLNAYNSLVQRANAFESEGRPVPEHVLNGMHKIVNMFLFP